MKKQDSSDAGKCVFCAVAAHTEPASMIYEDADILAFLDIRPVRPGQVLIVPRQHIDHFCDLPDELATRLLLLGQRLSRVLREGENVRRSGLIVHGFGVPHAHLIVLPLHHPWDITSAANAYLEDGAVKFRWDQVPLAARVELDGEAGRLAQQLAALRSQ
jgi:histidine triad (HIT) family protein